MFIVKQGSKKISLKVDGYELSFEKSGSGYPLILIHTWHPFAKHLLSSLPQNMYQIITFDAPGYYSKVSGKLVTDLSDLAHLLERLFDYLGFDQVDILGQCLGGVIGLNLAAKRPTRVRNLIVVTPPLLFYRDKINKVLRTIFSILERNSLAQFLAIHLAIKRQALREISAFFGGYRSLVDVFAQEFDRVNEINFNPEVFFGLLSSTFKFDFWETVKKVKTRTLFISGSKDILARKSDLEKLVKKMEDASYEFIPSAKHAVIRKKTKEAKRLVLNFLSASQNAN